MFSNLLTQVSHSVSALHRSVTLVRHDRLSADVS